MNFEQSLVAELGSINGLDKRVFPLYAAEGVKPPFIIYRSSEGKETQSLNSFLESTLIECEIHVIGLSYSEMKNYTKETLLKLTSFFGRTIGTDGPFISMVAYEQPTEVFEEEVRYYRSSFDLRVRI